MDKTYDHKKHEVNIYNTWENSGAFKPLGNSSKKAFTIIMPPPNANDNLHIGHARFVAIEDILVRYHRMLGEPTLWLPGSDHAGIETQFVFEKKLKENGKSRFDYTSRESLYKDIWDFVQNNKTTMENQLRSLGASCDWSRNIFTLDPKIVAVAYKTFKKLDDDKLLYRGKRLINYCTRCGTGYSELEVDHIEKEVEFYTLDYGCIKIATTRPETIFADAAIAVNPKDQKYTKLIGKTATIPIIKRGIPIIADNAVEIGLGTDALKVTPAHDFTDWEIGERHNLEKIQVISTTGQMIAPTPKEFVGKYVGEARKLVVEELQKQGLLIETKKKMSVVGICYRCKNQIEPIPCLQWFIKVNDKKLSLVKLAKDAVKNKETVFAAKKFEKIYNHWLSNLKDWNISRQIVWGIQIPAWQCKKCEEWTITNGDTPTTCSKCQGSNLARDLDTFDTWFSSGQWPFATLQTTQKGDFEKFYPTTVMETAYDILPFWVMRMMMLGLYVTKQVPFKHVLIHGLVRDKNGVKISKSKGNVINPLEMTEKYGTDSLRAAISWGAKVENDISLSEDNIKGMRNFANKIWNIGRFLTLMFDEFGKDIEFTNKHDLNTQDKEIIANMEKTIEFVTKSLDKYRLSEALESVYEFVWHQFADIYIETIKDRKKDPAALYTTRHVYLNCLKLLHPFMPYVTEAVWGEIRGLRKNPDESLITSVWPRVSK